MQDLHELRLTRLLPRASLLPRRWSQGSATAPSVLSADLRFASRALAAALKRQCAVNRAHFCGHACAGEASLWSCQLVKTRTLLPCLPVAAFTLKEFLLTALPKDLLSKGCTEFVWLLCRKFAADTKLLLALTRSMLSFRITSALFPKSLQSTSQVQPADAAYSATDFERISKQSFWLCCEQVALQGGRTTKR